MNWVQSRPALNGSCEQVQPANIAVLSQTRVLEAFMMLFQVLRNTAPTSVTVKEVFCASYSADFALIAMEVPFLRVIVIEITNPTMISPKLVATLFAMWLSVNSLSMLAFAAHDHRNRIAIELVSIWSICIEIVVTYPAPEHLTAAGTHKFAASLIVFASPACVCCLLPVPRSL